MKRAAIYLRVSTPRQAGRAFSEEGYSIETQREACQRRAAQLEAQIVGEFIDSGDSARVADRPKFQKLLSRVREERDVDVVIVYSVSRFARNTYDDIVLSAELEHLGVEFVSATEHFDDTPFGKRMRRYLAADAEFYSENLSQEAKRGLHKKAKHGGTPGPAPLGYLNVHRTIEGIHVRLVEPDADRAPHITWAFTAFATGGYTLDTLLAALADRGLVTRQTRKYRAVPVSRSQLARLLRNPYYVGIVRYGGVEYEGRHEPLIDKDTFSRVQATLAAHSNAKERDRKHHHYLKGSLVCALCGSRLTYVKAKNKTGTIYPYFACIARIKGTGCKLPYLSAEDTERKVAAAYADVRVQQIGEAAESKWLAHIEDVRAALDEAIAGMREQNTGEVKRQQRRITAIKDRQRKLLDAFLDDNLPRSLLSEKQDALAGDLANAERLLALAEHDGTELGHVYSQVLDTMGNGENAYRAADPQTRRLYNQAAFEHFKVSADGIEEAKLDPRIEAITHRDTPRKLRAWAGRQASSSGPCSNSVPPWPLEPPDQTRHVASRLPTHSSRRRSVRVGFPASVEPWPLDAEHVPIEPSGRRIVESRG